MVLMVSDNKGMVLVMGKAMAAVIVKKRMVLIVVHGGGSSDGDVHSADIGWR